MTWRPELLRGGTAYLDSNVLIYAFEGEREALLRRRLTVLFEGCAQGWLRAFVATLVRAEVLVRPLRDGNAALAAWYRELLAGPGLITVLPLDGAIADRAALLRARHPGLHLPDAVHLATALYAGCDFFITSDSRLAAAAAGNDIRVLDVRDLDLSP